MLTLAIVNRTTVVPDAEARAAVAALQTQISHHFSPIYGITCWLQYFPLGAALPSAKKWQVVLLDDTDQANALGYHNVGTTTVPQGFVFCKTDMIFGVPWSSTLSHEALELLADPYIGSWAQMGNRRWTAWEVCDAVENDSYLIDGVAMSDFLLPAWFGDPGNQYSYLKSVTAPFTLSPGGYMPVIEADGTYHQITARKNPAIYAHLEVPTFFSRRHRRSVMHKAAS